MPPVSLATDASAEAKAPTVGGVGSATAAAAGGASSADAAAAAPAAATSASTLLLVATGVEVALFGRSNGGNVSDKLTRIEQAVPPSNRDRKAKTAEERLGSLLVGTLCMPPLVEFAADGAPDKPLFMAFFPFSVIGIYETRADALEALRPYVKAAGDGTPAPVASGPHAFVPAMWRAMAGAGPQPNYVEAAMMAIIYPKHRKPLPADAAPTPAAEYRAGDKPIKMPRTPGKDFKELVLAGERDGDKAMVLMRLTW